MATLKQHTKAESINFRENKIQAQQDTMAFQTISPRCN